MSTSERVILNPFAYEFHADPYPTYRWLRDNDPCHHNEEIGFWALTRYADVFEASRDWRSFTSLDGPILEKLDRSFFEVLPLMIAMDPPDHDVLRQLVSRVFTPRRVASLEPAIRARAREHLDRLADSGGGDFVAEFASLLPMDVIFTLLGIADEDRLALSAWMGTALERDPSTPTVPDRAVEAQANLVAYWFELVGELRTHRRDDFVSGLFDAEIETDAGDTRRLSDNEIAGFCALIGTAGNETVTKLLANAAVLLARYPDQRAMLLEDRSMLPGGVEEVLRYWSPSQYQGRSATRELTYYGRRISEGDRVILVTGSANHDERAYDDPELFDILRRPQALPLGFGYGPHFCLGAALARLESRIALDEFLTRFPEYIVDEEGLERVHTGNLHGFEHVPFSTKSA